MAEMRFGSYAVLETLGAGGMGTVYLARQDGLERAVALKVMSASLRANHELLERFRREAESACRISHPGVARLYDFGDEDGVPYLAMELIRGKTLASLLASNGRMAPDRVLAMARELAAAVGACHAAGVLHRDIKPQNILIEASGRVVLVDLGLAKPLGATMLTGAGAFVGTPSYVPPEVLLDEPCTPAGDVYQVGVVVQEALTARQLYEGGSVPELLQRIATGPFPILEQLPGADGELLHQFVKRCLSRWPDERYADGAAALAALGGPQSRQVEVPGSRSTDAIRRRTSPDRPRVRPPTRAGVGFVRAAGRLTKTTAVLAHAVAVLARAAAVQHPAVLGAGALLAALCLFVPLALVRGPAALPEPSAPALAIVPAAPRAELVQTVSKLTAAIEKGFEANATHHFRDVLREVEDHPAQLAELKARWRERYRETLLSAEFQALAQAFRTLRPQLLSSPRLSVAQVRRLRTAIEVVEDLNHQFRQAFGSEWTLPYVELTGPGLGEVPAPPPGLERFVALRFGDGGQAAGRVPLSGPGVLVVPGRAHFNTVDHELLAVGTVFGEPSRYDYLHALPPTGGRRLAEAWVGVRLVGAPSTDKLVIGISEDSELRRGSEAEFVHGTVGTAAREAWLPLDVRRLQNPRARLVVFFEHRGRETIPPGLTLDWLVLSGR